MERNGIKYHNIDLAESLQAVEELVRKTGQMGVPVIEIDGDLVVGFNEAQVREKLGI